MDCVLHTAAVYGLDCDLTVGRISCYETANYLRLKLGVSFAWFEESRWLNLLAMELRQLCLRLLHHCEI
jgi:hypothetical protein